MQVKSAAAKKAAAAEGTHKIGQLLAQAGGSKTKKKPASNSTSDDDGMDLDLPSGSGGSDDGGLPAPCMAPEKPAAKSKKAPAKPTAPAAKDALATATKPKKAAAVKPKAKAAPVSLDSDGEGAAGPSDSAAPQARVPRKHLTTRAPVLDDSDDDADEVCFLASHHCLQRMACVGRHDTALHTVSSATQLLFLHLLLSVH